MTPDLSHLPPDVLASVVTLRALAQAFRDEFDRLEERLSQSSRRPAFVAVHEADTTSDMLDHEVRKHVRAHQPDPEPDPGDFSPDLPAATPEQLRKLKREHLADLAGRSKPPEPPPAERQKQERGRKLVTDYIRQNAQEE